MRDRPLAHSPEDLRALMVSYQAGDLTAFDELYRRLQPGLKRYLLSLTLNAHRAEDLLQETFLQLHRSRHTYAPPRPVAWRPGRSSGRLTGDGHAKVRPWRDLSTTNRVREAPLRDFATKIA